MAKDTSMWKYCSRDSSGKITAYGIIAHTIIVSFAQKKKSKPTVSCHVVTLWQKFQVLVSMLKVSSFMACDIVISHVPSSLLTCKQQNVRVTVSYSPPGHLYPVQF